MEKISKHHYIESGLDNVYIQGLELEEEKEDGDSYIRIPLINQLHLQISIHLLLKPAPLTGKEFYFLRAELGLSMPKLAKHLKVTIKKLQAWQEENTIEMDLDIQFRKFFAKTIAKQENLSTDIWTSEKQEALKHVSYKRENAVTSDKIAITYDQKLERYLPDAA